LVDELMRCAPPGLSAVSQCVPASHAGEPVVPAGARRRDRGGGMVKFLTILLLDRSGASALEYGLVVGLVALALIAGMGFAGNVMSNMYTFIATELSNLMVNA
jgi:pilus assembly protein Flp/PilA